MTQDAKDQPAKQPSSPAVTSGGPTPAHATPGRAVASEHTDGAEAPFALSGSAAYKKPSVFKPAPSSSLFGDDEDGVIEGIRDINAAKLLYPNPTWDPNAVVTVGAKQEKGGWVDATKARGATGHNTQVTGDDGVKSMVDKRMVTGAVLDERNIDPKLQSGRMTDDELKALTPAQVAQVNPLGNVPRLVLKNTMNESWHHAKEKLLSPDGNAPARQMLMAKLWEFRQWHHNMILERTQRDPAIGKDGLTEWKAAGSTTLTSDIDVNLKGAKTELAVEKFNTLFKADGFAHEAGVVYDVNVYAMDFMHGATFKGLAEEHGKIKAHKFGEKDADGRPKPDPETRVSAKEGGREGSVGGGVNTSSSILENRMVTADADLQRVWSLVKMRLYMTGEQWASYAASTKLPEATQQAVALRYNSYMTELSAKMADGAALVVAADAMKVTGFKMLDATANAKAATMPAHADGENVKMAASNRLYEDKLKQVAKLRTKIQSQIDLRKSWLQPGGDHDDAEALDAAIDGNLAILRDLISECAMYSNEAYVTDGAVNHVVVGMQQKIGIRQTNTESMDAFNENVADSLKEIARHDRTMGEAAYKAGKYLWRMADAALNLGVASTSEDATLTAHLKALYAAGNHVANKIKGGTESQESLERKAATAISDNLSACGVEDTDTLQAFVRALASRVSNASSAKLAASGQARSAPVKV